MTDEPNTTGPADQNAATPKPLEPGDTVGAYRITQPLGQDAGGTSLKWRARHTSSGQEVVIRQLIPGSPVARDRSFLQRCRQMVQRQQALKGQARRMVLINELIDDPRGALLVSDFTGGASVGQLLDNRPDPFDLVRGLRIVHSTAKALMQLHESGLVHGGLQPDNILLKVGGGVQVTDIGVATLIADQEALGPTAARYMAPELFRGEAPDVRSDIYALGMIAYEMLTGRGAFNQAFAAVLGDDRNTALRWMKWHTSPRAQAASLHELNPNVPERLSELVARMMAKDPAKRIATAAQLLEAIRRHFGAKAIDDDDEAAAAPRTSATGPGDTAALPPRKKTPMIIAAVVLVIAVVATGILLTVSTIKSNALEQQRSLSRAALQDADRAYTTGRFEEAMTLYREQAEGWPEAKDPLGMHARAGALMAQARIALAAGDYDIVRDRLAELDPVTEAGPADREAVKSLSDEADRREAFAQTIDKAKAHLDAGEFAQARALLRDTQTAGLTEAEARTLLDLQVQIDARVDSKRTDEALARADELADAGDLDAAIKELADYHRRHANPRVAERLDALELQRDFHQAVRAGETAIAGDDLDRAVESFEQALALRDDEALSARLLSLKSRAQVQRGKALSEAGDTSAAVEAFTAALGYDPDNTEARGWLARLNVSIEKNTRAEAARRAEAVGDYEQAAGHYRAALEQGPDDELAEALDRVESKIALAKAEKLMAAWRLDEAGEELDKAQELAPDNPAVAEALKRHDQHVRYRDLMERGDGFAEQGRYGQATQAYRDARDVMNTEQINQRLDDTEYNHLLAQARGYIANEQWTSARGILTTAARLRVTDELTALREEVARHVDQQSNTAEDDDGQG